MLRWPATVPALRAGDFTLRAMEPRDTEHLLAYLSDAAVIELTSMSPWSRADVVRFIEDVAAGFRDRTVLRWALADAADAAVGTCGFFHIDARNARAEIGYDLARQHWGHGVMTAAARAAVDYGREVIGFERIEATVLVGNDRSARVLEKLGFAREGVLRSYKDVRGARRDFWMYGLTETA
jgi:RimJ/RimL family protein N-acetyltransferase